MYQTADQKTEDLFSFLYKWDNDGLEYAIEEYGSLLDHWPHLKLLRSEMAELQRRIGAAIKHEAELVGIDVEREFML